MSRKNNLRLFKTVDAGDMSAASITSQITSIQFLDNVGIQINFTGAPVGIFQVEVSADHAQDLNENVTVIGQWTPILLSYKSGGVMVTENFVPTSVGSPIYLDLNQLSAPYIRLVYTRTSGTGVMDAFITAKLI